MELPPPAAAEETSVSDVLTNEDLLNKILLGLRCRSCLVGAALTSKRWLRGASRIFVPDFCERHSPRLLGVYVSSSGMLGSEFIPHLQPDDSNSAVSDVLNQANFGFGNLPAPNVWDCQNGLVLFEFGGDVETFQPAILAVRFPLRYPNLDMAVVLPQAPQFASISEDPHAMLLPVDHGDDALCYRVHVRTWELNNATHCIALVGVLRRSGYWSIKCIEDNLAKSPIKILPTTVLAGGKIYMATEAGYILGLDIAKEEFFIVDLPEDVELDQYIGNLVHCRGDDSVLYLFHVDRENRLNVWLRSTIDDNKNSSAGATGGGANGWVLRDTISVHETCGHLVEEGWEKTGDGDEDAAAVMVVGAGDNAEFVFLELGATGVVVYMHLKTREVKQVYQREEYDDYLISVRPFMFVGRPVFPALDAHEGEAAAAPHQE